jgi:predicted component of type VI protein secretion system
VELLISVLSDESGTRTSARCSLDSAVTLGRGPESPVPLDGTGISREHLRLHADGDAIFVTDLSSNGTWLNTRRLTRDKAHSLTSADAVRIPGFEIRIELPNTPGPEAQPARPAIPAASVEPVRRGGPLQHLRDLSASLSKIEKLLIALALAMFALVGLYWAV